jgi:O-antigen/teichoic acid export membrane protein
MIPRVSALENRSDREEIIRVTARAMRKLALVFFPLYALLIVAGREVITVLFTPAYEASWPIFAINLTMIPAAVVVLDPVARAFPNERFFLLRLKIAVFVLLCVILWFGTERLGPVGVIALVIFLTLAERAVALYKLGKDVGVSKRHIPLLADVGKSALAAAAAGGAAFVVKQFLVHTAASMIVMLCALTFCAAYLLLILSMNVTSDEERLLLRNRIRLVWRLPRRAKPAPVEGTLPHV